MAGGARQVAESFVLEAVDQLLAHIDSWDVGAVARDWVAAAAAVQLRRRALGDVGRGGRVLALHGNNCVTVEVVRGDEHQAFLGGRLGEDVGLRGWGCQHREEGSEDSEGGGLEHHLDD